MKTGARKCRGFESHPLRHAAPALALAIALAACSILPGRQLTSTFPALERGDGEQAFPALPVVLTDLTGGVVALDPAPGSVVTIDQGIAVDPVRPNVLLLRWQGSPCDTRVLIDVAQDAGTVSIVVTSKFRAGPCDAIGIVRDLAITLSGPADPSRIRTRFTPEPEDTNS